MNADRPRRLVIISPAVPEEVPEHAGGRLLTEIVERCAPEVLLTVVVPQGPAVSRAVPHPRIDRLVVIPSSGLGSRGAARRWAAYVATGEPAAWFVRGLRACEEAVRAVATADVVDLQWQEQAKLVPWIREVNPRARVVVLLHDVLSQAAQRSRTAASGSVARTAAVRLRWSWARGRALGVEARLTGAAPHEGTPDALAVLSAKDAALLPPGPVPVIELSPPLGGAYARVERTVGQGPGEILMVAYLARWSNEDALRWFTAEILPRIRKAHPRVRVRVAGGGIRPAVAELAGEADVQLLGFVPDLAPLYAAADVAVVPLREGAGLKFKVLDALSAGVPVVTTPVGAEGVGPEEWFADVVSTPVEFASAVNRVLSDRPAAERRARTARREVARSYADPGFRSALRRVYGADVIRETGHGAPECAPAPEVTVVIPAFNADATIAAQLDALAHQVGAPPFEVVIADNRSTDGTAATARRWAGAFPCGLRVVGAPARQGVSHARNRGCQEARAEHILICDADDRVQPNWVREMARAVQKSPVVGSDSVPVVGGVEQAQESGLHTVFGSVDYVLCGALGIHRWAWAEVGGFDESFPAGHEDVDFCRRLTAHGHRLHPVHSTAILYTQRPDARGQARQAFHYAQGRMLLWTRLAETGVRPPVSFTGSVREALQETATALWGWRRGNAGAGAHELGWAWGTVAGHLRYRVLGRPPAPRLWPPTR